MDTELKTSGSFPSGSASPDYPFIRKSFLSSLEDAGLSGPDTPWETCFSVDAASGLPLYLRTGARGEYVFDYQWSEAARRSDVPYWPRLVTAIPYTPVAGPRCWGFMTGAGSQLWQHISNTIEATQAGSWHLLFPDRETVSLLEGVPLAHRKACHFKWFNRGYSEFDDFLAALKSRKRKSLRKERQSVTDQGIDILRASGMDIPAHWWPHFWTCYASTYSRHGQVPYLSADFFRLLADRMPEALMMVVARKAGNLVAAALYFQDSRSLYGRYWGTLEPVDGLHFELCYYQGIDYAIATGRQDFDPGVQGEHKLLRGFEPVTTDSLHWIRHPGLFASVRDFCQKESHLVARYRDDARQYLPYRNLE